MPAVHAAAARRTRPDVDAELADDGPDHRQIALILNVLNRGALGVRSPMDRP